MRSRLPVLMALCVASAAQRADAQEESDRVEVRVTGMVLLNTFHTSRRTNNFDLPQFVLRPSASDSLGDGGGFGMTVRQTRLGVRAFWPDVRGAEVRAEVDADFYGGQQSSGFGDLFPLFRIRRAVVDATWSRGSVLIGQEVPLIAEYNPLSTATVGFSGLSASGNLWLWLPQIRGSWRVAQGNGVRLNLEGAVVAAGANEPTGELFTQPDRAEASDRPALQGRVVARWGSGDTAGDLSVGAHRGWLATRGDSLLTSTAVAATWRVLLGTRASITGEVFSGQALAGLGGGGVGQHLGAGGVAVRSRGGWSQLLLRAGREVTLGGAFGVDNPSDSDLDSAGRLRNATWSGVAQWTPAPFVTAVELRRLTTTYRTGAVNAVHLNLSLGVSF